MAVREILKMGDARLLRIAKPIQRFDTPELHALIADMFDTMRAAQGAGLAAPQIGVDLQVVIFVGENRATERSALLPGTPDSSAVPAPLVAAEETAAPAPEMAVAVDPARVMFILPDGRGSDRGRR